MTILSHFRGKPRPQQVQALLEVERSWATHDVFVLRLPVAAGKSRVLKCIVDWAGGGALLTPSNLLVSQYHSEWPELEPPRRRSSFGSSTAWAEYLRSFKRQPVILANYYSYLALRAYKRVVCFDEAHNLVSFLQDKEQVKVWGQPPGWIQNTADLGAFAAQTGNLKLSNALGKDPEGYTVRFGVESYRGKPKPVTVVTPLTPAENAPILWPSSVKKIVLASATLDEEDLKDLGLDGRRVRFIDSGSPIPASRRPVYPRPAAVLSKEGQLRGGVEDLAKALLALADKHPGERGLVHVTYDLGRQLRPLLGGRFLSHHQGDKESVFRAWQRSEDGILLGAGLTEGVDLAGDKARWQVISKILFPNLGDPAVFAKAQRRPRWYKWSAVRDLLQATGRVCRTPEDYGVTYVLDAAFKRLYNDNPELFPGWFKASLR
jgi:hypothetical protein